ncbi:hypothetical protein N665_0912s0002 [Sinapis alba]|nr:hypothetical protein N665_0912s0002 [Sinapis alba]
MILTVSVQETKYEWVLDSGCTFHITPNKHVMFDLEELEGGKVLMGNNTFSEVTGIRKLKIVNLDESNVVLTKVRYLPTLGRNLIYYGQFEKNGCNYEGSNYKATFFKQGKKVLSGCYKDGLYYLQSVVAKAQAKVARA